jgi:hypothetical protein
MPLAVVVEEPVRRDIKSCPPDGYVMIKRLTYGEKLERRKYNSKMEMKMTRGSRDATSIIDIFKEEMELYDFAHAVDGHNLTKLVNKNTGQQCKRDDPDAIEVPLDFLKPSDVKMIAGQIAEEIGKYIDELNNFEEDEETGNSKGASAPTS